TVSATLEVAAARSAFTSSEGCSVVAASWSDFSAMWVSRTRTLQTISRQNSKRHDTRAGEMSPLHSRCQRTERWRSSCPHRVPNRCQLLFRRALRPGLRQPGERYRQQAENSAVRTPLRICNSCYNARLWEL